MTDQTMKPALVNCLNELGALGDRQRKAIFHQRLLADWNDRARRRFLERLGIAHLSVEDRLEDIRARLREDRKTPHFQIPATRHLLCREVVECGRDIRAAKVAEKFAPQMAAE